MADATELKGVKVTSSTPPGYPAHQQTTQDSYPPVIVTVATVRDDAVEDNTVLAAVSILFCFVLGITAAIKANQAKSHLERGDVDSAQKDSAVARLFAQVAISTGLCLAALAIVVYGILPAAGILTVFVD
ncbi:hypothetical protein RRG08_017616 [Elysia crispata]|uniref:Uncharacterized protein n=1 Tax=Elysia crispata TaxID=231223 RepID=A0AAE1BBQ3_9GAST|nr:hypothetical protein RRG08_017616 [Elysia crispata]